MSCAATALTGGGHLGVSSFGTWRKRWFLGEAKDLVGGGRVTEGKLEGVAR